MTARTESMPLHREGEHRTFSAVIWALAQSWGGKIVSLFIVSFLARHLTVAELGLAAAVGSILALAELLAEQGYGDALVQKHRLEPLDLANVFYISLGSALVLLCLLVLLSGHIAAWLHMPELPRMITVAAIYLPIAAAAICQQALYRRALQYQWLAIRFIAATLVSGVTAIACVLMGMGAWSLIVQMMLFSTVSTAMLWLKPKWTPTLQFSMKSALPLFQYSSNILALKLVEFAGSRAIEFIIATRFGAAALGAYALGSKLYQTAMQLLSGAVLDVAHSAFSRLSHDVAALHLAYYRAVTVSAALAVPCFVGIAAVSVELCQIMFGANGAVASVILRPLAILGAMQCVEFFNGTCLNALGIPSKTMVVSVLKTAVGLGAILLFRATDTNELVHYFVYSQILVMPVCYAFVVIYARVSPWQLAKRLAPFVTSALAMFYAVEITRNLGPITSLPVFPRLLVLSIIGGICYGLSAALLGRAYLAEVIGLFVARRARQNTSS